MHTYEYVRLCRMYNVLCFPHYALLELVSFYGLYTWWRYIENTLLFCIVIRFLTGHPKSNVSAYWWCGSITKTYQKSMYHRIDSQVDDFKFQDTVPIHIQRMFVCWYHITICTQFYVCPSTGFPISLSSHIKIARDWKTFKVFLGLEIMTQHFIHNSWTNTLVYLVYLFP